MRSLIGLKNMIMFSAVLLAIGSVSDQEAFAGGVPTCRITFNQSVILQIPQNDEVEFEKGFNCNSPIDSIELFSSTCVFNVINIEDPDLPASTIQVIEKVTNGGNTSEEHCEQVFRLTNRGGESFVTQKLWINVPDRPIGGTSFPVSTTSLLVAGAQANMGLWSLALIGIVGTGAAIIYKTKSKKTEQ